jgi:uncharacterized surface protein with fasciclin (FAS1) repeats
MKTIFDTAREDSRLRISVKMMEAGGLVKTLRGTGPYTAFIPTDEAFEEVPAEILETIMRDRNRIAGLVMYHVVRGKLTELELADMEAITTLQEDHLDITGSPGKMQVGDATIIHPDIECTNGMYHVIDAVLIPRAVRARVGMRI